MRGGSAWSAATRHGRPTLVVESSVPGEGSSPLQPFDESAGSSLKWHDESERVSYPRTAIPPSANATHAAPIPEAPEPSSPHAASTSPPQPQPTAVATSPRAGRNPTPVDESPLNSSEKSASGNAAAPLLPQWHKALYERQPFDDNYVDPVQFLQEMRKNENLKDYRYGDIVRDTFAVVQQISFVAIFVVVFAAVHSERMSILALALLDAACVIGAIVVFAAIYNLQPQQQAGGSDRWNVSYVSYARQAIILSLTLMLLSPVLRTMTQSYSTDTIWALCLLLLFIHIVFTDFSFLNGYSTKYHHGIAVNAATFCTVLLASRISSSLYASVLIGFGVICFSLSPIFRHRLKCVSMEAHMALTFTTCGIAIGSLLNTTPLLAIVFLVAVTSISFVIPWGFVRMQSTFKFQINGPWDEAKPRNSAAAAEWANAGLLAS